MKHTLLIIIVLSLLSCTEMRRPKWETIHTQKEQRKLRYIMKPNHCGIIGFFNDGTVAGTIDASVTMRNLATLDTAEVFAHYTIDKHYIIFNDDHSSLDFSSDIKDGYSWLMVDYEWKKVVGE